MNMYVWSQDRLVELILDYLPDPESRLELMKNLPNGLVAWIDVGKWNWFTESDHINNIIIGGKDSNIGIGKGNLVIGPNQKVDRMSTKWDRVDRVFNFASRFSAENQHTCYYPYPLMIAVFEEGSGPVDCQLVGAENKIQMSLLSSCEKVIIHGYNNSLIIHPFCTVSNLIIIGNNHQIEVKDRYQPLINKTIVSSSPSSLLLMNKV